MLQTLFESALDAIMVFDDDGRYVDANPAACLLFGVPRDELLQRRTIEEFFGRDAGRAALARLIANGTDSGDTTIHSADGRLVRVEYRAKANFLPGRHLAVLRDVTERQRAERELRSSAEFLRRLIESSHDCIKVLDVDGRLLSINDGGRRLLEVEDVEPYIGRSWLDLWAGSDDLPRAADAIERARRGEAVRFEGFAITPAGTPRWWDTAIAPINGADGRPERLLAVTRDISERVRADQEHAFLARVTEALTESLDYQETLQRITRLPVPFLADLCFLDIVEGGAIRRAAWTHGDPAWHGRFDEVSRYVPPLSAVAHPVAGVLHEARGRVVPDVTDAWMEGVATSAAHLAFMQALGIRSLISVPLTDPGKLTAGILTLATAHSGRRYGAAHLALAEQFALRAVLAVQNARLYAVAQEAREVSEATNRAKDEFLAMLAHELRNPLAAILNGVATLNRIGAMSPEARQARGVIRRQTEHLAGLLDDLLDVARIGQRKMSLELQPLDIRAVVERAFEAESARFDAKRQQASMHLAPAPVIVRGDAVRLRQIVANLVNNASKYTPAGGRITVAVTAEGGEAVVRVRDSGVGIPPEKLGAIFDLFTQLRTTTGRTEGGLGLGLTLVKRLADLHGGTVVAVSDGEGKGSEFVLRLPLLVGVAPPTDAAPQAVETTRHRILVIEDNPDARDVLAMSLELEGHEVFVAGSAEEGLKVAWAERPAVIIVDIGLPDADGYEVARRLRETLGHEPVLVAFSGYGQPEDRRRSLEAGFDAHVVKPVALETLLDLLAKHVPRRGGDGDAPAGTLPGSRRRP